MIRVLNIGDTGCGEELAERLSCMDNRLTVCSESDPSAALDRIRTERIDCVISRFRIPGTDGLELLEQARQIQPDVPFVFYTDREPTEVVSDVLAVDATEYVPKSAGESAYEYDLLSTRVTNIVEQSRTGRTREKTRLEGLIREMQSDLVHATTREEIDTAVCKTVTETDPYTFAWAGAYRAGDQCVVPRTAAGFDVALPDALDVEPDDGCVDEGPIAEAVRTRSVVVTDDVSGTTGLLDEWGVEADCQTLTAVPFVHEDELYGVAVVYADRQNVFDADSRDLLAELGETVGHAHYRAMIQERYETQYRELFEDAPVMVSFTREEGGEPIVEECNRRFAEKLGYDREELEGRSLAELYTGESAKRLLDRGGYDRAMAGEFRPREREFVTSDGDRLVTLLQATPRLDEDGNVVGTHALYVDITGRKRAQEVLEQAEAMEAAMDGMAILDEDGQHVYVNKAHAEIYGYDDPDRLVGESWRMLYDEEEIERFEEQVFPTLDGQREWRGEATGLRNHGSTFSKELSLTALDDGGFVCVVRDVTERKERERELVRYESVVESMDDVVFVVNADREVEYVNPATATYTEVPADSLEGLGIEEPAYSMTSSEEDAQRFLDGFERALEADARDEQGLATDTEFPIQVEVELDLPTGTVIADQWISPLRTNGEVTGAFVISRDITERRAREQEIAELKERLELAVDGANLGIWDWDMTTDEVQFNDNWATMLGYDPEEIDSHLDEWEQRVHPEDMEPVEAALDEHIAGDTEYYDTEHRMRTADGNWKWIRDVGKVVSRDDEGEPTRAVGIHVDIDERKRAQRALREERDLFTQGPAVVFKWRDEDGWPVEYVSENVTDVLGYTPEQLQSGDVPFSEVIHEDDIDRVNREARQNSDPDIDQYKHEPYRVATADGDIRWVLENTTNIHNGDEITHRLGYLIDITERRKRERKLEYYERIINTFGDIATVIDPEGTINYVSPSVQRMLGYEPEDLVGTNGFEYQSRETKKDVEEAIESVIEHPDEPQTVQTEFRRADGSWCWIESTIQNRIDDDRIEGLLVNSRDITERKKRERQLEQFREAVEQTGHAVYITDTDGTIEYVNPAFEDITGYDEEVAIGQTVQILRSGEHDEEFYEAFWETVRSGEQWEDEIIDQRADGEQVVLHQTVSPLTDDDGEPRKFVAVAQDITERKKYEEALEQAREELRQIIDLVPDLIFAKNREGEYLLANEATAQAYGLTPEAVEGHKEHEIIPDVEDAEQFREDDLEVIETGEPKEIPEEELTTADGETKVLQTTKIPYAIPGSGEDAVLGYGRDVTELKEYERTLEEQRDNLEVLNQVVRHDVRNDLQLVLAYAETLEGYVEEDGEEYIRQILEAAREAVDITTTARDVTEILLQQDTDRTSIPLRPVLESEVEDVRSSNEQALVTIEDSIPRVEVLADGMLESVVRNLLTNAIAHNDKEVPKVAVSATATDEIACIQVADNGPGVPDDQKERIFEEGEKGLDSKGTGLGLYLVKTLVDRYEGDVRVEDNDPEGSVFVVEIPLVDY